MIKSLFCAIALALAVAAPAIAQPKADEHAAHHPAAADMADGEVRKIDKAGDKIRFTAEKAGTAYVVTAIEAVN